MSEGKIIIDNAEKTRCTVCHTTLRMFNDKESLFCNILVLYSSKGTPGYTVKCKQCKAMNVLDK